MRIYWQIIMILLAWCIVGSSYVLAGEPIHIERSENQNNTYSMTVSKASLSDVVEAISRSYKMDILGINTLEGTVTGTIHGKSPLEMLQHLGAMYDFDIQDDQGIVTVTGHAGSKEHRHIMVVEPNIASSTSLESVIKTVVPSGKFAVHKETNQIVLNVTGEEEKGLKSIIQSVDRDMKQVRLEATIMAMEHSYTKETGFRWSWLSLTGHGNDKTNSYGAISFGKAPNGEAYKFFVKPELSLLETSGKAVVIATPSIMALNGEAAHILIGERIPVIEESISNGERKRSIHYEEVGIKLDYTPVVTKNGTIDTSIRAEVSSPIMVSELKSYKITTRQAQTRVRLQPGEVLVIGGLMDNRDQKQIEKIPVLGDIPLLGKLFRHSRKTKDSVEMVIFVKATVV